MPFSNSRDPQLISENYILTKRRVYSCTLRLKTIRPFAVYSYKFMIFDMFKKGLKVIENQPILLSMLEYIRYYSPRDLGPKFTMLLKIQAFKVRIF